MIRRIFAVWPPAWTLAFAGSIYLFFQAINVYFEIGLRVAIFSMPDVTNFLLVITIGFVALYAAYRVAAFHPAFRPGYYEWLCGTPWTSRKPLPLGPVHLVWQDLLLLAVAFALAWPRSQWLAIAVIQGFLAAYVFMLGFAHLCTGQKAWGYATLFGLGFMILFVRELPSFFGTAAIVYGIAFLGLRAALAAFPWRKVAGLTRTLDAFKNLGQNQTSTVDRSLGWPYDQLGPNRLDEFDGDWDFKVIFGALLGWWFFVVHDQLRQAVGGGDGYFFYYWFLAMCIFSRLSTYCNGYAPPIDLNGRLATGRLIIPGYDQVFVAPLSALAVGVAAWYVPGWLDIDPLHVTSFALVFTWWIIFAMPPGLKIWRLTGNHRITAGWFKSAQQG